MLAGAFSIHVYPFLTMHVLSDHQAQQLTGGSFRSPRSATPCRLGGRGFGMMLRYGFGALQAIFTNVNQVNVAVNLAINGGQVISNQANVLAIHSSI